VTVRWPTWNQGVLRTIINGVLYKNALASMVHDLERISRD
jgi:hypothetical protein